MSTSRVVRIESISALREAAPAWDDLWQRSEITSPLLRAEMVAQWVEHFAPRSGFHALAVEEEGCYLAALPLVRCFHCPGFTVGGTTTNDWSPNGDLLLDRHVDADAPLDTLVTALRLSPWQFMWFKNVPLATTRWLGFRAAMDRAAMRYEAHEQTPVGLIELGKDWDAFERSLSGNRRRNMRRCTRRLGERGTTAVDVLTDLPATEVRPRLYAAFEIEDLSWKGEAGSSVLRSEGLFDFYARQAEQLAAWRQLELAFLHCGDRPVSFVYGYVSKGVSHWHKIGYAPELGCCTPGQLLQWELLHRYHGSLPRRAVDTLGPLTHAIAGWKPQPYPVGRLTVALRGIISPLLLRTCEQGAALRRRWRHAKRTPTLCSENSEAAANAGVATVPAGESACD